MKLKSLMNDFIQNYLDENAIKFEDWNISINNQDGFGDYSSNIALKLTKQLKAQQEKSYFIHRFVDQDMIAEVITN